MIWFFLMGMIGGAAGVVMYAHYWVKKHTRVVKTPPLDKNNSEEENRYDGK